MSEMGTAAEVYVRERVSLRQLSRGAAHGYRSYLNQFAATYGDRKIKSLGAKQLKKFLATQAHLAASTQRTNFSRLRQFVRWLTFTKRIRSNPLERAIERGEITVPKQPGCMPHPMVPHEVGATFALGAPDRRARAIIALAVQCGLRCCEVSRARIEDWRRHDNMLRVHGKGGRERWVPVPTEALPYLTAYLSEYPARTGQPLIRSYVTPWKPLAASTISKYVSQWMVDAGVKERGARDMKSAHALRHTAATDVLDVCGDLQVVQMMLGHQNLGTTAIYLGQANAKKKLREAMEGRDYRRSAS